MGLISRVSSRTYRNTCRYHRMPSPYEIQIKFVDKLITPSDLRKLVISKVSRFRSLRVWEHEKSKYQFALIDFYDKTSARKITLSRLKGRHELRRARPLAGMGR